MRIEFVYAITCDEQRDDDIRRIGAVGERTARLNHYLEVVEKVNLDDAPPSTFGIRMVAGGHDRSMITRQVVAPIMAVFRHAKIDHTRVKLVSSRVLPNMRAATVQEGRAPKGTWVDPTLRDLLASHQ